MKLLRYLVVLLVLYSIGGINITANIVAAQMPAPVLPSPMQTLMPCANIPASMIEPFGVASFTIVMVPKKLCKWHALPVDLLSTDLLAQFRLPNGHKSACVRCVRVSWLLFPYHQFW